MDIKFVAYLIYFKQHYSPFRFWRMRLHFLKFSLSYRIALVAAKIIYSVKIEENVISY